jgi:hypothetical protein
MSKARSLNNHHGLTDNSSNRMIQNNKGTVMGATIDVVITILIESAILPFTISVNAGEATAAGMEVRRKIPIARLWLNALITKKTAQVSLSYSEKRRKPLACDFAYL